MPFDYSVIIGELLKWYHENARTLPWRSNPEPYHVWVSEIMLQQTRVEAVKDYFSRFIQELPGIGDLANVSDERLLKLWEGLGYYTRARNLKKAAGILMERYRGELPASYEELLLLPGIGSYTAGAIASIAYGHAVPAVDGNVLRVAKRLSGSYDDISKPAVKRELEEELRLIIPPDEPGDFNQALMELGAVVCIPNGRPLCETCPVSDYCEGYGRDIMTELPVKASKKARRVEQKTILVLEYQNRYALHKREDKGLLAGLWEFPNLDGSLPVPAVEKLLGDMGITNYEMELSGEAKHVFSHVEWHMLGYRIRIREAALKNLEQDFVWVDRKGIDEQYALPAAFRAYQPA